jgi:hypothetical protein
MTEPGALRVLFWIDVIHAASLQRMCACSRTSAQRPQRWNFLDDPHECFGRVKATTKNKIVPNITENRAIMASTTRATIVHARGWPDRTPLPPRLRDRYREDAVFIDETR